MMMIVRLYASVPLKRRAARPALLHWADLMSPTNIMLMGSDDYKIRTLATNIGR